MSKELDPKQKYMGDKTNLRVKKQEYEDDGNRYIFPAGEAAPGAAIAPVAGQVPLAENINNQFVDNVQAAAAMPSAPKETFLNPNATQVDTQRAPADINASSTVAAPSVPEAIIPDQSGQTNKAFNDLNTHTAALDTQIADLQKQKALEIDKKIAEDDANVPQIEPHGFFHGKSTWQKILGGVGMFLGAFTPEGAKNVASIIEKEIDRDIDAQKTNIKLKQDKNDKNFQRLMDRYGSQEAALLAKKRDAYTMLDLHLKRLELNARNAQTRETLQQGRELLGLKQQANIIALRKAAMEAQKEASKGSLPGYQGSNGNPAVVKDLTERLTAQKSANTSIDRLESLLKEGALIGKNKALAEQEREKLAADLAKAMFGRSSDSELEVARGLIPDVTSMTQRGSVDSSLLKNLKQKLAKDMEAASSAAGYTRVIPSGKGKIN